MRVRMPARKVARRAGVAGKLHGWDHRVIADNAVEAIETRGRETVEPPELHRRRRPEKQAQPFPRALGVEVDQHVDMAAARPRALSSTVSSGQCHPRRHHQVIAAAWGPFTFPALSL